MDRTSIIDRGVIDAALARARHERSLAFWAMVGALRNSAANAFQFRIPQAA